MKQLFAFVIVFLLLIMVFSGCTQSEKENTDKLSIVCTIFPQYDWVRQILGDKADNFDLTLLMGNKTDLHNYQPSVDDIARISNSDLFICVGGESDIWVESALRQAINRNMIVINLMAVLGDEVKIEEILEGMEYDKGDEYNDKHDYDDDYNDDHEYESEYDEHVWLSLRHTKIFCAVIANALSALDADNSKTYNDNLIAYIRELSSLDAEYQTVVSEAPVRTLVFGDRFPFRYLVDDYGISYYAAFPGCSAETEASFETIVFLSRMVDELNLNNILVTESADQSIAGTIISNTRDKNRQIYVLDSMQSVTSSDVQNGTTYLSIMKSNLNVLKEALK